MRISDASNATGLSIDTLRFYEKEGLVRPERNGSSRTYSAADIERLEIIAKLRRLGVTIPDIRSLLTWDDEIGELSSLTDDKRARVLATDDVLARQIDQLDRQMDELQAARAMFAHMREKIALLLDHGGLPDHDPLAPDHPDRAL